MLLHHKTTGKPLEVNIRAFRPEDAAQVIDTIRDAYGESYVKPFLYQKERLIQMNASGEMPFSVAEAEAHRIVGITAYEVSDDFPGMAEIACQVIRSDANGYGLALPLALHAMHCAEARDFSAQFSRALGCHLISQKTLKAMGFTACGFLLHVFDPDRFHVHFPTGSYGKIPQAIAVKCQYATDTGSLWLPDELAPLADSVYRSLGVRCKRTEQLPDHETVLLKNQDEPHRNLTLRAVHCGRDFARQLSQAIAPVAQLPLQTVNLYLNLRDAQSRAAYQAARDLGFFPTGLLPCCGDGEYAILHHSLSLPLRLEDIPYIPDYAPFLELMRRHL